MAVVLEPGDTGRFRSFESIGVDRSRRLKRYGLAVLWIGLFAVVVTTADRPSLTLPLTWHARAGTVVTRVPPAMDMYSEMGEATMAGQRFPAVRMTPTEWAALESLVSSGIKIQQVVPSSPDRRSLFGDVVVHRVDLKHYGSFLLGSSLDGSVTEVRCTSKTLVIGPTTFSGFAPSMPTDVGQIAGVAVWTEDDSASWASLLTRGVTPVACGT